MTVVVVKNHKKFIEMVADSYYWCGSTFKDSVKNLPGVSSKISVIDDIHVGFAGNVSTIQIFKNWLFQHKPYDCTERAFQDLMFDFKEYTIKKHLDVADRWMSAIFVYQGKCFVYQNEAVYELLEGKYYAIGAGYQEATMCLFLGQSCLNAVKNTIKFNNFTGGKPDRVVIDKSKEVLSNG